jgi:hypothetical protein
MENNLRVNWKDSFIEKFIYAQGETDIPEIYLRYIGLSIISAVLQNRVWMELYPGDPLYPNLYTFLIGPSGVGKGRAISAGIRIIEACGLSDHCGMIGGSMTSASILDFLASKRGSIKPGTSRAYIVHPELASSIKWGDHSDALIKRMTDLFTSDLANYTDSTRTSGIKNVGKPCVSWLAGSTRRWLVTNLKSDVMAGGFMARGLFVEVFQRTKTIFLPEPPQDRNDIVGQLQVELAGRIYDLEGMMSLTEDALEYLKSWYMTREEPKSEEGKASWNRHRELSMKIAMILSASEGRDKIIKFDHLFEAISMVESIKSTESDLWGFISSGGKMVDIDFVSQKIELAGEIEHSELLNLTLRKGVNTKRLYELITVLEQMGKIRLKRKRRFVNLRTREVLCYEWLNKKPTLRTLTIGDDYN